MYDYWFFSNDKKFSFIQFRFRSFFYSLSAFLFVDAKWDIDCFIKVQTYSYDYEFFGVCLFFFFGPSLFSVSYIFCLATKNVAEEWKFLDFVRVEIIQCS